MEESCEIELSPEERLSNAKKKVKDWESEYIQLHGSRPDKEALLNAPSDVKKAYKTYHHYRKILTCSQNGNECPNSESTTENIKDGKTLEGDAANAQGVSEIDKHESIKKIEDTHSDDCKPKNVSQQDGTAGNNMAHCKTPANSVWGRHLNKSEKLEESNKTVNENSLYKKMAEKLKVNGTVKMRKNLTSVNSLKKGILQRSSIQKKTLNDACSNSESSPSCKETGDAKLDQLSFLEPRETGSELLAFCSHASSLQNDTAADLEIENYSQNLPFKIQRRQSIKNHELLPVSALSSCKENESLTEKSMNRKIHLDPGWLARSTGADVNTEVSASKCNSSGSWKMRLIDQDWTQDFSNDETVYDKDMHYSDEDSDFVLKRQNRNKKNNFDTDKFNKQNSASTFSNALEETRNDKEVMKGNGNRKRLPILTNTNQDLTRKELRTLKPLNVSKVSEDKFVVHDRMYDEHDAEENCEFISHENDMSDEKITCGSRSIIGKNNHSLHVTEDIYDFTSSIQKDNDTAHSIDRRTGSVTCTENLVDVSNNHEPEKGLCKKRRRKEDLDELEKTGVIQSSWPPPKKVRKARKKATAKRVRSSEENDSTNNSEKLLQKTKASETSGKKERGIRKNKMPSFSEGKKVLRRKKEKKETLLGGPEQCNTADEQEINTSKDKLCDNGSEIQEYDELAEIESCGKKSNSARPYLSKEDYLKKKVSSGSANNNFVRINLKKKVFVRGKKHINLGKYKRQEWKKRKAMKDSEDGTSTTKSFTCFKCGDFGHWAKYCPGKKGDALLPLEHYDENESTFLSLEDAAALAQGIKPTPVPITKVYAVNENRDETNSNSNNEDTNSLNLHLSESVNDNHNKCSGKNTHDTDVDETPVTDTEELQLQEAQPFEDVNDEVFLNAFEEDLPSQLQKDSNTHQTQCDRPTVDPLYDLENGNVGPTTDEVYEALQMFGFPSFRSGQENTIMRILSGLSTLLVLSTGSGKSLCYQLPAYLYAKHRKCITLCISPLVSLMEDQVSGLPKFMRAVCLHTHQNNTQRTTAISAIRSGSAEILIVSPEAVVGCSTGGILGSLLKELPAVAFACLDEAHCVSEWSHNFRPSYLRVCQVLREKLGVKTILGLTATARQATTSSIAQHLGICDMEMGIIRGTAVPKNLLLSVSRDENREQALVTMLQGDRFSSCNSIIIYCTRRDECERVATLIRTQLLVPSKIDVKKNLKKTRSISFDAEAYHAGLSSFRRQQVQNQFMSGKLRIVVATVAFGMGIDKSDVHGIIHFNMPKNVESYVQEIGRAGRDGKEAHCHLFLDARDGKDIQELKRHIYVDSVDRHTVRKILNQVFKPCACVKVQNLKGTEKMEDDNDEDTNLISIPEQVPSSSHSSTGSCDPDEFFPVFRGSSCPKHEVALPINDLVEKLDLPDANIETMLCYLELHWGNLFKLNSHVYANCTVACYGGPRQLVAVSRRCPPLAVAIALERMKGENFDKSNRVRFPVVDIASRMGWNSKIVKRELKALEWNTSNLSSGGTVRKSGVSVEFSDLSFHMEVRGDLADNELDSLLDALYHRIQLREKEQLRQLNYTYQLLFSVSHKSVLMCCDDVDSDRCEKLRDGLSSYFARDSKTLADVKIDEQVYIHPDLEGQVRSSVRGILSTHIDQQWTGRAMARIFHGIGSPNFPADVWGRVRRIWRQHLNIDFNILVKIATQEILRSR